MVPSSLLYAQWFGLHRPPNGEVLSKIGEVPQDLTRDLTNLGIIFGMKEAP